MSRLHNVILVTSLILAGTSTISVFAAGSSGGGMGSGSYNNESRQSTEQLSGKAFRAGIKQRDRAIKMEAKAALAKTDKARDKALVKAQKYYAKAITKQGEAVQLNPQNYEAANELGYALRKTGQYRKAIGAYNYALDINPNYHRATEYRGEAYLTLGMFDQTKKSYMTLFRSDRDLADQLMASFDTWLANINENPEPAQAEFATWVEERKRLAAITGDLSTNNTRNW